MKSTAEILFEKHLAELDLPFVREYHFHPERKWRADFYIDRPFEDILIEIEGGTFSAGRHTRGKGYQADLDKYNQAMALGFTIYRFSTTDVLRGRAKAFLAEHLK